MNLTDIILSWSDDCHGGGVKAASAWGESEKGPEQEKGKDSEQASERKP